jgi:hypothetical protein
MKKLLIILGVVLLSGTDVLAAKLNIKDSMNHNLETCSSMCSNTTQVSAIEKGMHNNDPIQDSRPNAINSKGNIRLTIADVAPEDRGSPDTRGGSDSQGGGSR